MKKILASILLFAFVSTFATAQTEQEPAGAAPAQQSFLEGVKSTIEKYLGRRYVWGATGIKSFDCSGFIWRVMYENGILIKRTTARKLYMMLPKVSETEKWQF